MKRKIIKIDPLLCNGCGLCVEACHEQAIKLIDGIATLIRDDYCDGLGDCLPVCPTKAISFEVRDTVAYDPLAVEENIRKKDLHNSGCSCPGSLSQTIKTPISNHNDYDQKNRLSFKKPRAQLKQWPIQIKLVPTKASYFDGANLLIVADCCAYAYGSIHEDFIKDHITLIGCPKLDFNHDNSYDYSQKLADIIASNNILSIKLVKMEVPCCNGLLNALIKALKIANKIIPWQVFTISIDGKIIS